MVVTIGQLASAAAREIAKRLFKSPESGFSGNEIATVVRQNIVGQVGTVVIAPGKTARSDSDETVLLIVERCLEMLARSDGIEVTITVAADKSLSVLARRAGRGIPEKAVLLALGKADDTRNAPPVTVPIAASSLADGHMEVFAIADGGRLRHRWYWPKPNWSGWRDMRLPAGRVTAIAAGSKLVV